MIFPIINLIAYKIGVRIRNDYETLLANGIKDNPKAFWHYVNSKLKTKVSVGSLHLDNGNVAVTDQDKADTLNIYFSSVFTKENLTSIPVMNDVYPTSPIADITIHREAIYNKLRQLDISKFPG